MKRLNINKYYCYCSYSLDEQEANQQDYWFDMKHFKMINHRGSAIVCLLIEMVCHLLSNIG